MAGPDGKDIPLGKSFEVDFCTVARWENVETVEENLFSDYSDTRACSDRSISACSPGTSAPRGVTSRGVLWAEASRGRSWGAIGNDRRYENDVPSNERTLSHPGHAPVAMVAMRGNSGSRTLIQGAISGDAAHVSNGRPACEVEKPDERQTEDDHPQGPPTMLPGVTTRRLLKGFMDV